jgi:HEAT repeat protein
MASKAVLCAFCILLLLSSAVAGEWETKLAADPIAASARMARLGEKAVGILPGLFAHESAAVRRGAALTAGRIGETARPRKEGLVHLLADPAPAVRAAAAWALARIGLDHPPAELTKALQDTKPVVRRAAAGALESFTVAGHDLAELAKGIATAPDDLVEAILRDESVELKADVVASFLDHGNANVRLAAIRRLGADDIPAEIAARALRHADRVVREETARDVDPDDPRVPVLLAALRDPDPEVRRVAAWWIPACEKTRAALLRALTDEAPSVRMAALERVGWLKEVPALIDVLADPDPAVAAAAARELGDLQRKAIPALVKVLDDPKDPRRRLALRALSRMFDEPMSALPAVVRLLDDPDPVVRLEAANAILAIGGESDRAVLRVHIALSAKDPGERLAAARLVADTVYWITEPYERWTDRMLPLARRLLDLRRTAPDPLAETAGNALEERGFDDIPEIEASLEAAEFNLVLSRERVALRTGRAIDLGTVHMLEMSGHRRLRPWQCLDRLADPGVATPECVDHLRWFLHSGDPVLADRATVSLVRLGLLDPPPVRLRAAQLRDPDAAVRWRAIKDLAARGAEAREFAGPIEALREDEHRLVRVAAAAALTAIRGPR